MAKAKQLPSGNWRVQATLSINGERVCKSFTASTAKEAEIMALQWQSNRKAKMQDSSSITVGEAIDAIIEMKSNVLSPATITGYKVVKNNYIKEIAKIELKSLNYIILQTWVNNLSAKLSPKTVHNAFGVVSSAVRIFNPSFVMPKITMPQKKKPSPAALTQKETAILLNGIGGHPLELQILFAIWLGLRRSELYALDWEDIDFENMKISINKALVQFEDGFVLKSTKTTDSERVLSLPIYIANKLLPFRKKSGRVFDTNPHRASRDFPKLCEELGLPRYRFHDLRHSMATVGVSLNIADKLVMARGGWNNVKTLKNIYQAVLSDDTENANSMYDNYFNQLIISHEKSHEI